MESLVKTEENEAWEVPIENQLGLEECPSPSHSDAQCAAADAPTLCADIGESDQGLGSAGAAPDAPGPISSTPAAVESPSRVEGNETTSANDDVGNGNHLGDLVEPTDTENAEVLETEDEPSELVDTSGPETPPDVVSVPPPSGHKRMPDFDDPFFATESVPPPPLSSSAIYNRLWRVFQKRKDGSTLVDQRWFDAWADAGKGRHEISSMFEKVGYDVDRGLGRNIRCFSKHA